STCDAENIPQSQYPHTLGLWWNHENNRDYRFRELIAEYDKVDEADIRKIKNDPCYPRNPQAPVYQMVGVVRSIEATKYPDVADAVKHLQSWDLCGQADNKFAALSLMVLYDVFKTNKYGFPEIESGFKPKQEEIITS